MSFKAPAHVLPLILIGLIGIGASLSANADIDGIYQQVGLSASRQNALDETQTELIDTFSGQLRLRYLDAAIPGAGGFDLPIIRHYVPAQISRQDHPDETNEAYGAFFDLKVA